MIFYSYDWAFFSQVEVAVIIARLSSKATIFVLCITLFTAEYIKYLTHCF